MVAAVAGLAATVGVIGLAEAVGVIGWAEAVAVVGWAEAVAAGKVLCCEEEYEQEGLSKGLDNAPLLAAEVAADGGTGGGVAGAGGGVHSHSTDQREASARPKKAALCLSSFTSQTATMNV